MWPLRSFCRIAKVSWAHRSQDTILGVYHEEFWIILNMKKMPFSSGILKNSSKIKFWIRRIGHKSFKNSSKINFWIWRIGHKSVKNASSGFGQKSFNVKNVNCPLPCTIILSWYVVIASFHLINVIATNLPDILIYE